VSADLKEFRFSPLRCDNEGLACACQDAARRTPFDQLSFQFLLEGGELPRHGRMVHAQTPGGTENLTRAGDLQEDADPIPIHRLQLPHNKSAIILVDVQTSTFHGRLAETRKLWCFHKSIIAPMARKSPAATSGRRRPPSIRDRYLKSRNGACPKAEMRASR
jgi:hypothetical protein